MKHFDLTPIENFLREKNLTMNEVARDLYVTGIEISRLGMYSLQYIESDALKITADSVGDAVCSLQTFGTAFIENNLQEFFIEIADPNYTRKELKDVISVYKNIIAGLTLLNIENGRVDYLMHGREDHVVLLSDLADLCLEIEKVSEKAAC
jgi:hypothetical protein